MEFITAAKARPTYSSMFWGIHYTVAAAPLSFLCLNQANDPICGAHCYCGTVFCKSFCSLKLLSQMSLKTDKESVDTAKTLS